MSNGQQQLLASILEPAPAQTDGLAVYIGNRRAVTVRAFSSIFPTVEHLLGDAFNSAVLLFMQQNPPAAAEINLWGTGFASWLARQEELVSYPYIAAVAELEWQINMLERAADTVLDLHSFELLQQFSPDELQLVVNPNCIQMKTPFPLYDIWKLHQEYFDASKFSELNNSVQNPDYTEYLCLTRADWKVNIFPINEDDFYLLSISQHNASLQEVVVEMMQRKVDFPDWLSRMLKIGAILGYSIINSK